MEYILIFIAAVFVNNVVLAQFLGIVRSWGYLRKWRLPGHGDAVTVRSYDRYDCYFLVQKYILDKD